jgi:4'-phosphopantetheinyl transferase
MDACRPDLAADEVHIWLAQCPAITAADVMARYREIMNEEEVARQARFRFERDRHRDLVARALVRTTLSHYADLAPEQWRFSKGEHGKPSIVEPPLPLRFNLSHSHDLVACAVALHHDVGVDIECSGRHNDVLAIARRYFSATESAELFALPTEQQRDRFFDYWTLKEAYIKARGEGISLGLGNFSFHLPPAAPIGISFAPALQDTPGDWQFRLFKPLADYRMALAWRQSNAPMKVRLFSVVPLDLPGEWSDRA